MHIHNTFSPPRPLNLRLDRREYFSTLSASSSNFATFPSNFFIFSSLCSSVSAVTRLDRWSRWSTKFCGYIAFVSFAATRTSLNSSMVVIVRIDNRNVLSNFFFRQLNFGWFFGSIVKLEFTAQGGVGDNKVVHLYKRCNLHFG